MRNIFGMLVVLLGLVSFDAAAAEYQGLAEKNHIVGSKITAADLEGKVVFVEYWGLQCPPCRAAMPHLQQIWEKHGSSGKFMMFGSHLQGRNEKAIKDFVEKNKVTFPIYQGVSVVGAPVQGGIPHAVLIDHTGKVVKAAHPSQLYGLVDDLVKAAPETRFIVGSFDAKFHKSAIAKLTPGKSIEGVMKDLERKSKGETPSAAEARTLLAKCQAWVDSEKASINTALTATPALAVERIQVYKRVVPSDKSFDAKLSELRGNREVQSLMQIRKTMTTELERFAKNPKPSKMTAAKFESLKKRLGEITDTSLAEEVKFLTAELETHLKTVTPS